MRSVPERPALLTLLVLFGCFVAGPVLGLQLGARFSPDSELGQLASTFAFPLAFFAGLLLWLGLGVATVLFGGLRNLLLGRPRAQGLAHTEALVPPGYGAFVVVSVLVAGGAGLLVWLLSDAGFLVTLSSYAGAGGLYGLALYGLAHHGYLPFPEPA